MSNLKNRLAALEARYQPKEKKPVFCFPVQKDRSSYPLADGVCKSRYGDCIEYETRAKLDAWIAMTPNQSLIIITQDQYDEIVAELEAEV